MALAPKVGVFMRREWFTPFETSMSELGVTPILLGEKVRAGDGHIANGWDGIVVELSSEVMGSPVLPPDFGSMPIAGVPVTQDSEAIARTLGIHTVLWGEDQARQWLETLQPSAPASFPPLLAVWGTPGAPGASRLAVEIARQIAKNRPTLVIDADFVAPSIAELLAVSGESSGLLGALRVCRNDNPSWDSVKACAGQANNNDSLHVLTGVRPGSLGRIEAAGMSTLLKSAASAGVVVVVETKCLLGSSETSPERNAVEAIVRSAHHLYVVTRGTDLGVARLVRDWELLNLENVDSRITCVIRTAQGSRDSAFSIASEALWGLTGCPDIRLAPSSQDATDSSGISHLLEGLHQVSGSNTVLPQAGRKGWRESLQALMIPYRRQPLP